MFLVQEKNGKEYKEGEEIGKDPEGKTKYLTWDDLPKDINIVQLRLTYPFKVHLRAKPDAPPVKSFAPILSFGRYDEYYFSNEATVKLLIEGTTPTQVGESILQAKIIGGIDLKRKLVVEIRLDKCGNCTINRYPLRVLKQRIRQGAFRSDIIRKGAL